MNGIFFWCFFYSFLKSENLVSEYFEIIYIHFYVLSFPKVTANLYCICLSILQIYTKADAVHICGNFWDTQYAIYFFFLDLYIILGISVEPLVIPTVQTKHYQNQPLDGRYNCSS